MEDTVSAGVSESTTSGETSTPAAERPSTPDAALDAAFAELSAPAEPAPPTPEAQAGEAPTTEEPPKVEDVSAEGKKGPIPFTVHQTALENARVKASQETEQRLMEQLRQELQPLGEHIKLAQALQTDYAGTVAQLLAHGAQHPQHGQAVIAAAARLLAGKRGQVPQADPEPPRFAEGQNGELLFDPALDQKWREWNDRRIKQQLLGEVEQKYAPLMQAHEQQEKAKAVAAKWQEYEATVTATAQSRGPMWDAMPFMEKDSPTREAILKRQAELSEEMKQQVRTGQLRVTPVDLPWVALQQAYSEVAKSHGIPSLRAKEQQQLIQTAVTKTRGSQSDPLASAPTQPRKGRTVDEALDLAFSNLTV
jgi:hypothetical protein